MLYAIVHCGSSVAVSVFGGGWWVSVFSVHIRTENIYTVAIIAIPNQETKLN